MTINTISYGRRHISIIPDAGTDFDITTIQSGIMPMNTVVGNFTVGEAVTQATSGAAGVVKAWDKVNQVLVLDSLSGAAFDITHKVTGGSSSAEGYPTEVRAAFPNGIRLSAVDFYPSATTDVLVIRDTRVTGAIIYERAGGTGVHQAIGGRSLRVKPYIDKTDCTFGTAANVRIIMEID